LKQVFTHTLFEGIDVGLKLSFIYTSEIPVEVF